MTQLLEIKDKLVRFYSKYETYLSMIVKFVVALVLFTTINSNIGYMSKISTFPVALILSLVCSILSPNAMICIGGLLVLADMYALALEAATVTFVLFVIIYFLYFRFAPKDGIAAAITPILFRYNISYVMPVAMGLLRNIQSIVAVVCGTVVYYFFDGIRLNASILSSAVNQEETDTISKLNIIIGQLKDNKEMLLTVAIFVVASLLVYFIRMLTIEHAWTIAIVAGTVFQMVGLLAGYSLIGISGKGVGVIVGCLVSMLIGFLIQFFLMNLDYARTERVQFEDDDYYYYVVAIPKKMIASREKKVQRFGNTMAMGRKIERKQNEESTSNSVDEGRRAIAEELDIDENLLK